MKRRPEINTRDPPKIRSSSVRGFNGVRSYPETNNDVIRGKRVKFTDPEFDCPPNIRHNASSVQHDAIGDPGSNAPKTSEYAFFKKLKKDAGGCCRSYPLHKEDNQSKKFEPSGCTREIANTFKDSCDDLSSSLLVEKARSTAHNLFMSPHANELKNSEATKIVENSHKDIGTPLHVEKVKPINHNLLFSPLCGALKNSGTEFLDEKVFSGKRRKLRQWVAETSLPEVKESCLEGCDLVSVLLNRLFPDSNENNYCRDAKPTQMRADAKYSSHAFPESNTYDKDFHWTQRRDLVEAEQGWFLDDFCNGSREIITSKWDTKGPDSPSTSYAAKNNFQYENEKFGFDYEGGTASLITVGDPYFCCNLDKYQSTASIHIKELNEFQDLDDSATGRGPCPLLLGWDFDNLKDERDLSITSHNAEMNSHSILAASWDHHQQSLDGSFYAGELYSSSFFSNYPSNHTSLPHSHSANLCNWDVGRFLEEEKFLSAEPKHFPLSLSCSPNYLNLREDCNIYNSCEGSSTVSPQSHDWVISKVFGEKYHPDLEALVLPSQLGFEFGWKCLSMSGSFGELNLSTHDDFQSPQKEGPFSYLLTEEEQEDCLYSSNPRQTITHFAEDTLDSHARSSTSFQIPLDKETSRPLLLDSTSWLTCEEDIHYDDDKQGFVSVCFYRM